MSQSLSVKRFVRLAVFAVLALAIPACGNTKVNKANYEKIANGMTLKEVEEILGGPGVKQSQGDGSNVAGQFGVDVSGGMGTSSTRRGDVYDWESEARKITVYMDHAGRVANKQASNL